MQANPVLAERLTTVAKATAVLIVPFGIPILMLYVFWKMNQQPKEVPVTVEEAYPDEHLGIG